ncbi:MAG: glucosyl-3-phosphoglycerate synthase [Anaerolineae bacterium]|nr:glucosyl-3-phosphoglycerate synthase [Anaerolineae bacterium]
MSSRERGFIPFRKILVPVIYGCDPSPALTVARLITRPKDVLLVGLMGVAEGESLSTGAVPAREIRCKLQRLVVGGRGHYRTHVHVSHDPWKELILLVEEEKPDLLVLEWPCSLEALGVTSETVLVNPPCDIALVRGPISENPEQVLVPLRGGLHAELALRLSLAMSYTSGTRVTSYHLRPLPSTRTLRQRLSTRRLDAPFRGLAQTLASLPEVRQLDMRTDDPAEAIVTASHDAQLVIMGASTQPVRSDISLGPVTDRVLHESDAGVIVLKTHRSVPTEVGDEMVGKTAISVLVDKWFAENTYHANEFANLQHLVELKKRQNVSISLALPALNEEKTVGNVIRVLKTVLMDDLPLLDEIVLIDSSSSDSTREIAAASGVPVYIHQKVLPQYGIREGKGEALWKSLYVTQGDIVIWIDTDILNIHPHFVYGLLGPMLLSPHILFVKGFYRRPLRVGDKVQAGGGGRVTELSARPLLNLFYPELSGVIQPLSGEYGGRRSALEQIPFYSGYGVETGLLIGMFEEFGLSTIAQVDLLERIHRNQPLEPLSKMSFAIIQTVIHKLESRYGQAMLEDVNKTMKLIRYDNERFFLEIEEIAERERLPMIEIPEYAGRVGGRGQRG